MSWLFGETSHLQLEADFLSAGDALEKSLKAAPRRQPPVGLGRYWLGNRHGPCLPFASWEALLRPLAITDGRGFVADSLVCE